MFQALSFHSFKEIAGELLDAVVGAFGFGVDFGTEVAGRGGERVAPPDGGGVEDKVSFGTGIDGGGVSAAVGFAGCVLGGNSHTQMACGVFQVLLRASVTTGSEWKCAKPHCLTTYIIR